MKYIITEEKLFSAVGKFFSRYIDLQDLEAYRGRFYTGGSVGWVPDGTLIVFVEDEEDEIFRGYKEEFFRDERSQFIKSKEDDKPSFEEILEFPIIGFNDTMAERFSKMFGRGNWERPLMNYINEKLGTQFNDWHIY